MKLEKSFPYDEIDSDAIGERALIGDIEKESLQNSSGLSFWLKFAWNEKNLVFPSNVLDSLTVTAIDAKGRKIPIRGLGSGTDRKSVG